MLGVNLVHTRNLLILKHNLFSMKVNTGHETSGQQSSQINYSIRQRQFKEGNYPPHYHVLMMCVNNSIYAMKSLTDSITKELRVNSLMTAFATVYDTIWQPRSSISEVLYTKLERILQCWPADRDDAAAARFNKLSYR